MVFQMTAEDLGQQSKKPKVEESQASAAEPSSESAPIVISEALAKFFGTSEKEMLQSEVYKRVEEYIEAEGLEVGEIYLFKTINFYLPLGYKKKYIKKWRDFSEYIMYANCACYNVG